MSHNYFGSQTMTQVALIVRDIEAKVKIYADLFDVEVPTIIETAPEPEAHTRYQGEPTEASAKLAFFDMGSLALELIEPIGGPSTWAPSCRFGWWRESTRPSSTCGATAPTIPR